ncbi:unnamed protein product [Arabidopsis thaliana]|uniref:Uncharacterized protein n=1 Tax=Arabidopsis thaliana TaxID=3702 RepID=A0A654FC25_ARATH|nr:unnamed protein product [Arabidopsis thaliana]
MSSMETQKIKASFISLRSEKGFDVFAGFVSSLSDEFDGLWIQIWLFEKTDLRIKGRITLCSVTTEPSLETASSMEAKGLICGLPAKNVIPRLRQQPQQPQQPQHQANNN